MTDEQGQPPVACKRCTYDGRPERHVRGLCDLCAGDFIDDLVGMLKEIKEKIESPRTEWVIRSCFREEGEGIDALLAEYKGERP